MSAENVWRELLAADVERWKGSAVELKSDLFGAGVRFGDRHLCNHLRPKFLTEAEYANLKTMAEAVMAGIMLAKDRILEDPKLMDLLGLSEIEREMVSHDPGFSHPAPCVRLDSFITRNGPQFVELNGECPAGSAYGDRLAEIFFDHPLAKEFIGQRGGRYIKTLPPLLATLLSCWREFAGDKKPNIAIVDYNHVPTAFEFELCKKYFEEEGYQTIVCDPRELDYDGETLSAKGMRIDLVYKRVLINEFIERYDDVKNMYLAYRDGNACVVNPFQSKLVHKKAIFAVLTADDRDDWLDPQVIPLIDKAVPWTRVVTEGQTRHDGVLVDLLPYVVDNKDEFVLKPNDDYGGKGITLGWEVDAATWQGALEGALNQDFVVQKRLYILAESFPAIDSGLIDDELFVDLDPYLYLGKMHGALARLGAGSLCNVSSGGGQVPLYVVD